MNYIIYGEENSLVLNKIDEIIKENKNSLIIKYDEYEQSVNLNDVVASCRNTSLFNPTTLVLYKDPHFLINKVEEDEYKSILDYINKPEYETTLVLYSYENLFNGRLKAFKDLSKNSEVIKYEKLNKYDFVKVASSIINEYKLDITKDAKDVLISSCNLDLSLLKQNLNVLSLYPETIDINAIKRLITYSCDEDVFNLINALTRKRVNDSIRYARRLLANEESSLRVIATLANQLRFLYSVDYYLSIGKSKNEILEILKVNNMYRIDKALESLRSIKGIDIMLLLSKLSNLDYILKAEEDIDEALQLELFIVSLIG